MDGQLVHGKCTVVAGHDPQRARDPFEEHGRAGTELTLIERDMQPHALDLELARRRGLCLAARGYQSRGE